MPAAEAAGAPVWPRQRPVLPGKLQDCPGPVQAVSQQTPFAQNVEAHCEPLMQASPSPHGGGVGVAVGVIVAVGVVVAVGVGVGVAASVHWESTHVPLAHCEPTVHSVPALQLP